MPQTAASRANPLQESFRARSNPTSRPPRRCRTARAPPSPRRCPWTCRCPRTYANAYSYLDARRRHLAKHAMTLAANEAALAAPEQKAEAQLEQVGDWVGLPLAGKEAGE